MYGRWRTLVAPAGLALGLLATACGGSPNASADGVASASGSTARNAAETKSTDPQQAGLDFAKCMREHGVDMADPVAGEGGRVMIGSAVTSDSGEVRSTSGPPAGFEEADAACRHFLGDLIGDGPGQIDPQEQDRALKFAKCMRDNGVDMPDPDFSGGGIRMTIGVPGSGGITPDSEVFQAAQKACGSLFGPAGGAAPGGAVSGGAGPGGGSFSVSGGRS
jgi:hypothetical protein